MMLKKNKLISSFIWISIYALFYLLSLWIFKDFKAINNYFYIRLLFPALIQEIILYVISRVLIKYKDNKKMVLLILCLLLFNYIVFFILGIKSDLLQFDTFQIYDMSRYTFTDFGRMDMIRQHIYNSCYEISFPPLFSILMSILNLIFNFGVFSSVIINYIVVFLIIILYIKCIEKSINKAKYIITVILVTLMLNKEFMECVIGGSTIPLNILLLAFSIYLLFRKKDNFTLKDTFILSIMSGFGLMNRFDYLPIAVLFGLFIPFINKKINFKLVMAYFLILILIISPWIFYSYAHFGKIFATDNGRRLINVEDTRPSTFFTQKEPAETIFTNFNGWLNNSFIRWKVALKALIKFVVKHTGIVGLFIIAIFLVIKNNRIKKFNIKEFVINNKVFLIIFISLAAQTFAIILTGYSDLRYHINFSMFVYALLLIYISNKEQIRLYYKKINVLILIFLSINSLFGLQVIVGEYKYSNNDRTIKELVIIDEEKLYSFLKEKKNVRLIINRNEKSIDIARFAGLSRFVTILTPSNLNEKNACEFIDFFDMNYIYTSDESQIELFNQNGNIIPTAIDNLYMIKNIE